MKLFKNKKFKFLFLGLFLAFSLVTILALPVLAQTDTSTLGTNVIDQNIALGSTDIRVTVVRIINTVLGLLGIIAVGIVLYGGFVYMTAGGDDTKISTAKKILTNGIIGLVIILSSFAITKFVLNKLAEATGLNGGGGGDNTNILGNCHEPESEWYALHGADINYCPQFCAEANFVVQSITPSTKGDDVVGMNNVIIRAVFSRAVAGNVADAVKIEKNGLNVTASFTLQFAEGNKIIEAIPNDDCTENLSDGKCLGAGSYTVNILNIKDVNGNLLEIVTSCGTYSRDASFKIDTENIIDKRDPILSNVTLNGQSGSDIELIAGRSYIVTSTIDDRNAVSYGGNSFVSIKIYKQGDSGHVIESHLNGPATINPNNPGDKPGSSPKFSFNYGYRAQPDSNFQLGIPYTLEVVGHDIDNNTTTQILTFIIIPASCTNGVQDSNETGIDTGGVCRGGLGDSCKVQTDCSTSFKCLNADDNLCNPSSPTDVCLCKKWPYIEKVDKNNGAAGNWITISGRNFGNSNGEIYFNYDINGDHVFDYTNVVSLAQCRGNDVWHDNWIIAEVPEKPIGITVNPIISVKNLELAGTNSDSTSTPAYSSSLSQGHILDLHLNESSGANIVDSSGKGNNLQVVGTITYGANGKFDKAFSFEKDADSSTVTTSESGFLKLRVNPGQSLDLQQGSIFAWIKKSSPVIYADTIVSKSSSYGLFVASNGQLAVGEWYTDGLDHGGSTGRVISSGTNVVDGQWHQVGLVFNHGVENSTKLYVDGDLVFTTTTQFYTGYLGDFVVGANNGGGAQFYTGLIDEVNIWNRVLSQDEITSLYNTVAPSYKFTDFTNDDFGPRTADIPDFVSFTYNDIKRPGLCSVKTFAGTTSAEPKTLVTAIGKAFAASIGNLIFGNTPSGIVNWSNELITSAVPFANEGKSAVYVQLPATTDASGKSVPGETSNAVLFTVEGVGANINPIITSITPATTTVGSYITISGRNFGSNQGSGYVTIGGRVSAPLPDYCSTDWSDTEIVAKVAVGTALGADNVYVITDSGKTTSSTDAFVNIVTGEPRPSICEVTPNQGSAPLAGNDFLTLTGENFSLQADGIYFWGNSATTNIEDDLGASWFSTSTFVSYTNTELKAKIPYNSTTGLSMNSGPIVVKANGQFSNGINYQVIDCRLPNQSSPANWQCCQSGPEAGIWKNGNFVCQDTTRDGGYVWRFTTGKMPEVFSVLEQCDLTDTGGVVPSPTPWSVRDAGKIACVNAQIQAVFTLNIATTTENLANFDIYTCGDDGNNSIDCVVTSTDVTGDFIKDVTADTIVFHKTTASGGPNLPKNTWYLVAMKPELHSYKTVFQAGDWVVKTEKIQEPSNKGCDVGGKHYAYCFDFKTTNEVDDMCKLVGALINPTSWTTEILGVIQSDMFRIDYDLQNIFNVDLVHPKYFDVQGITNQQCISMGVDGLGWVWGPTDHPANSVTAQPINSSPPIPYHTDSRGVATAWRDNMSTNGSDIFATYENKDISHDYNLLDVFSVSANYSVNSLDNIKTVQDPTSKYSLFGNFSLKANFTIDDASEETIINETLANYPVDYYSFFMSHDYYRFILSKKDEYRLYIDDDYFLNNINGVLSINQHTKTLHFFYGSIDLSYVVPSDTTDFNVVVEKSGDQIKLKVGGIVVDSKTFLNDIKKTSDLVLGNVLDISGNTNENNLLRGNISLLTIHNDEGLSSTIEATSTIYVDLGNPRVIGKWPSCTEACVNAEIGAQFNQIMVTSTYLGQGITLQRCSDENCISFVGSSIPVDVHNDSNSQVTMYSSPNDLVSSTWYLVTVSSSIKADGGTSPSGGKIEGNQVNPITWKFKTKNSSEPCAIDTVDVVPDPFSAYYIGQKQIYKAVPRGAIDACSPHGQALNPWGYGWNWDTESSDVAVTTNFSISGKFSSACTNNCLPKGSNISWDVGNIAYPLCGNGRIDPGEDCDISATTTNASGTVVVEIPGVSCAYNCLRPGSTVTSTMGGTVTSFCGDGSIDRSAGEECDPLANDPYSAYCTSTCLNTGSSNQASGNVNTPICGSGTKTTGEDCDGGSGCSNRCLNVGTKLSQNWCDNYLPINSIPVACQSATSVCGDGIIEAGEECEIGLYGATASTCNNSCLLQNVCNVSILKQCTAGTEGCDVDCTLLGSSLSYSSPSVCSDGVAGIGETTSTLFNGQNHYSCELPILNGLNGLGGSPNQIVTAVGDQFIENVTEMTTRVFVTPINYYDKQKKLVVPLQTNNVKGTGVYNLMCGYTEYSEKQDDVYNDCPGSTGTDNTLGVGTNSCCYPRVTRSGQYPAVNAGTSGSPDAPVCRNTYLEVDFLREMNKLSFNDNVSIIEGYDQTAGSGYEKYNCEDHGQVNVSNKIADYLALATEDSTTKGFWINVWEKIKSFFFNLLAGKVFAISYGPAENIILPNNVTWCATKIALVPNVDFIYSQAGESISTSTKASLLLSEALDPNVYVLVVLQGGKNGIKDNHGVGIKNFSVNSVSINDSWLFKTGSDICKIKNIEVDPPQYVFTTPTSQKDFSINAVSNSGGQLISPIPGFYDWNYFWNPINNDIFTIPDSNSSTINIASKGVTGETDGLAQVEVTADIDTENSQMGQIFSKNFKLTAFFCANPWPSAGTNIVGHGSETVTSTNGLMEDGNYNFSFIYCADNNNPLSKADDLPLFDNVQLLGNNLDFGTLPTGDVALRRYLLFASSTNDAIGIQIFDNVPNFDGTPRSLQDWFVAKFGDANSMKPTSVGGYEALNDGNNYYVSVFDVAKTPTDSSGKVYNYIILFSLTDNSSQDSSQVFGQIINNIKFNIKMTDYNKCLDAVPEGDDDPIVDFSDASDVIRNQDSARNSIKNGLDCNTDFNCRDLQGAPFVGTSGYCNNEKTKFFRDLNRLSSLRVTQHNLDNYFTSYFGKSGFIGDFTSGSFIPGYTTSKWQNSWGLLNSYAGTVASDPINQWVGCPNHDPLTCWNAASSTYACPQFAEVDEYKYNSSTENYELYAPFEYLQSSHDSSFVSSYIDLNKIQFGRYCTPSTIMSYNANDLSVCGDGIINIAAGEECEPPNLQRCEGTTIKQCDQNSCTWVHHPEIRCDSLQSKSCGNGLVENSYVVTTTLGVDLREQCDDGVLNGRYGHCDINCQLPGATTYTGPGACGDGVKQSQYEYCEKNDLTNGVCADNSSISCGSDRDCKEGYTETQVPQYAQLQSTCKKSTTPGSVGQFFCEGVEQRDPISCVNDEVCKNINSAAYCLEKICSVDVPCTSFGCVRGDTVAVDMSVPISCLTNDECAEFTYMSVVATTTEINFTADHGSCLSSLYSRGFCSGDKTRSCTTNNDCQISTTSNVASFCRDTGFRDNNNSPIQTCKGYPNKLCSVSAVPDSCSSFQYQKTVTTDYGTCESLNEPTYDFQKINSCSYDCSTAGGYCGDGIAQWDYEECDDANSNDNDACKNDCSLPALGAHSVCGNSFVEDGEDCEIGVNGATANSCTASCKINTVVAVCGDGIKNQDSEECDLADQNGIACKPGYGQSCTYCSNNCITQTVESSKRCGNGIVDKDAEGNWLEQCDYVLDDKGDQSKVFDRNNSTVKLSCVSEQKGDYQCANNCQLVQNTCISCGIGQNLPLPQIGIINPMVTGGDSKYTSDFFIALLKEKSPGDYEYFFQTIPNPINYDEVNGIFTSSSVQHNLITKPFSDKGLETNSQCSYKLIFNPTLISDSSEPVNNKISNDLADVFDYPVNNESPVVNNEVIMSPAVKPNQIRVVIRWKKNGAYNFVGNFYSDKVLHHPSLSTWINQTNFKYSDASSANGIFNGMSPIDAGGDGSTVLDAAIMNAYVTPTVIRGNGFIDYPLARFAFHPIINTEYSGMQAMTFTAYYGGNNEPFPSSTLGFYVSSPNGPIDLIKGGNEVWVEVYHYHTGQVNMFSIYKPDFTFKLNNAKPSASGSANYWHVFNIHMDGGNILAIPVGSDLVPSNPTDYLTYMEENPFPTNYGGSIVTGDCGLKYGMPFTTKCQYYQ